MKLFKQKCDGHISSSKAMKKNMVEGFLGFTLAGFTLGAYFARDIRINKLRIISYLAFWAVINFSIKLDKFAAENMIVLATLRYSVGVFMAAGLPLIFSYF